MSQGSASHLRTLAAEVEALQQRVRDALDELDEMTPSVSFQLRAAFTSLGSAVRTLEEAADEAAAPAPVVP
ncbi:hypothetical protein ACWERV_22910 [Streptomyces sp. NPDC004031]